MVVEVLVPLTEGVHPLLVTRVHNLQLLLQFDDDITVVTHLLPTICIWLGGYDSSFWMQPFPCYPGTCDLKNRLLQYALHGPHLKTICRLKLRQKEAAYLMSWVSCWKSVT